MQSNIYIEKYKAKEQLQLLDADAGILNTIIKKLSNIISEHTDLTDVKREIVDIFRLASRISVYNRWNFLAKLGLPWDLLIFTNQSKNFKDYEDELVKNLLHNDCAELNMLRDKFLEAAKITKNSFNEIDILHNAIDNHYLVIIPIIDKNIKQMGQNIDSFNIQLQKVTNNKYFDPTLLSPITEKIKSLKLIKLDQKTFEEQKLQIKQGVESTLSLLTSLPNLEKAIAYTKLKQKLEEINNFYKEIDKADISTLKKNFEKINKTLDSLNTDLSDLPKEEIKLAQMQELNTFLENLRGNLADLIKQTGELENPITIEKTIMIRISKIITEYKNILERTSSITEETFKSDYIKLLNSSMAMYLNCTSSSISDKNIGGLIHLFISQKSELSAAAIDYLYLIRNIQHNKLSPDAIIKMMEEHDIDPLLLLSCVDKNKQPDSLRKDLSALTELLEEFNGTMSKTVDDNIIKLTSRLTMLLQDHFNLNTQPNESYKLLASYLELFKLSHPDLVRDINLKYQLLANLWKISVSDVINDDNKNKMNFASKQLVNFGKMLNTLVINKHIFRNEYKLFLLKIEGIKQLLSGKEEFKEYLEFIGKIEKQLHDVNSNLENTIQLATSCKNFDLLMKGEKAIKESALKKLPKQTRQDKTVTIESLKDAEILLRKDLVLLCGMSAGSGRQDFTPPEGIITNLDKEALNKLDEIQRHLESCELARANFSGDQQNYILYSTLLTEFIKHYRIIYGSFINKEFHKEIAKFYDNAYDFSKDKMKNILEYEIFKNMTLIEVINYYKDTNNWKNPEEYKTSGVEELITKLEISISKIPHGDIKNQIYGEKTRAENQLKINITRFIKDAASVLFRETRKQYEGEEYQSTIEEFKQNLTIDNILKLLGKITHDIINLNQICSESKIPYNIKCDIKSIQSFVGKDFIDQHIIYCHKLMEALKDELLTKVDESNSVQKMALLRLIEIHGEFFKIISRNTKCGLSKETSIISDLRNDLYHLGMEQYKGNILLRNYLGEKVQASKDSYSELTDALRIIQQTTYEIEQFKLLLLSQHEPPIVRQLAAEFSVTYFGQFAHLLQDLPVFLEQATLLESNENTSLFKALTALRLARGELAHQIQSVLSIYDTLFFPQTEILSILSKSFDIKIPKMDNLTMVTKDVKSLLQLSWAMLMFGDAIKKETDEEMRKIIEKNIKSFEAIFNINNETKKIDERIPIIINLLDKCAENCHGFLNPSHPTILKVEESKVSTSDSIKITTPETVQPIKFQTYVKDLKQDKKHIAFVDYRQYASKTKTWKDTNLGQSSSDKDAFTFIDFDTLGPKNTFNVSGLGNSCGLFSLTAGAIILCKINPACIKTMSLRGIIEKFNLSDCQNGTLEAHAELRKQIYQALLYDNVFKERRFHNFVSCCNQFIANKPTPIDMESFVCEPNNNKFMTLLKNEWHEHLVKIEQVSLNHETLLSHINDFKLDLDVVSKKFLVIKEQLKNINDINCKDMMKFIFKDIQPNSLEDFIVLQKLFSAAWAQIKNEDGSEQQRQLFNEAFQEHFRTCIINYLNKSEKINLNDLYSLSVLINCQFDSEAKLINPPKNIDILKDDMCSLYIEHSLMQKNSWNFCYENYCKHVGTQNVMLSADELGCLANFWQIPLEIKFNNSQCYQTNRVHNAKPNEMVSLCNVTRSHWEVALEPSMQQAVQELSQASKKIEVKDTHEHKDGGTSQKRFGNDSQ